MSREVKARRPYVSNVTSWNLRTGLRDVRQNGDAVVRRLEQLARTVHQLMDNTVSGRLTRVNYQTSHIKPDYLKIFIRPVFYELTTWKWNVIT